MNHLFGAIQELRNIQTLKGPWNHSEIRERRVTPADAGHPEENVAETIAFRHLLQFGARIGYSQEPFPRFSRARRLLHAIEEVLLEDIRLESAAGLAGNDEKRLGDFDLLFDRTDLRRIRGIKNKDFRVPGNFSECEFKDFNTQARSTHAQ